MRRVRSGARVTHSLPSISAQPGISAGRQNPVPVCGSAHRPKLHDEHIGSSCLEKNVEGQYPQKFT